MLKHIKIILFVLILLTGRAFAADIPVRITPAEIVSTHNSSKLSEGDYLKFKVKEDAGFLKKGDILTGSVTSIKENGFSVEEAQILIENFKYKNTPLKGYVFIKGNEYKELNDFLDRTLFIALFFNLYRGGEIKVKPGEAEYILYLEN